jgi:hypothetical protein
MTRAILAGSSPSSDMVESIAEAFETFAAVAASEDDELDILIHASSSLSHLRHDGLRSRLWSIMNKVWSDELVRKGNDAARLDFFCLQYVPLTCICSTWSDLLSTARPFLMKLAWRRGLGQSIRLRIPSSSMPFISAWRKDLFQKSE